MASNKTNENKIKRKTTKKVTIDKTKTAQAIADGIKDYLKQAGLY